MRLLNKHITPAIGNTLKGWITILKQEPSGNIPFRFKIRAFWVALICTLSAPFQWYEAMRLKKKIQTIQLDEAPVFIIGHWRSGTTHLHNLLSQDKQFGYVTTLQSIFPHTFMTNWLFPRLTKILMPPTRPIDDVKIYLNSPQEEEMAMVNTGPFALYHMWHFPNASENWVEKMGTLEQLTANEKKQWKTTYLTLLKKAAIYTGKSRMLLKNPPNTFRIKTLLELFPNAKFIYIHRNPYQVYSSTQSLFKNVLPLFQLQPYSKEHIRQHIIKTYKIMLKTYIRDRELIPEGNLIEVSYADLKQTPLDTLSNIYKELGIHGFEATEATFKSYIAKTKSYPSKKHEISKEERHELETKWKEVLKEIN